LRDGEEKIGECRESIYCEMFAGIHVQ